MKTKRIPLYLLLTIFLTASSCMKENDKSAIKGKETIAVQQTAAAKKTNQSKSVSNPLPSWNNTKTKQRIIAFVKAATDKNSASYIPPKDRVATFDNDGTLWAEHPTYFQIEFVLYRIKKLAPEHPEWKKDKLIQTAISHDLEKLRKKYGAKGMGKLMAISQADMTTDEFTPTVKEWIKNARHPVSGKLFTQMVYQPMLELIKYLQGNQFNVYIVSGGGIDFIRTWAEEVYGIPKDHVIGSYQKLKYEKIDKTPVLMRSAEILFVDNAENKPVAIHRFIGRKPVISFGNSDGDLQMLEWCNANQYKSLPAYIHHTDAKREWAYDRDSRIGKLDKGLDEAAAQNWLIVDMKKDWKVIYPFK